MNRKASLFVLCVTALIATGCPVTTPVETVPAPPGDPDQQALPFLSITATASFLQFNALGLSTPQFPKTADLLAVLSSAQATSITWSIESTGTPRLAFQGAAGSLSDTATGEAVTVAATATPTSDVSHTIVATATLTDNSTLTARITIVVTPDPVIGGESTILSAEPFTSPAVGVSNSGQVVLSAGVSGQVGSVVVEWTPADPANVDPGITLPADLTGESITLDVAAGVSGVFPFRATVTDSIGNVVTAIVNVFLGIVDLTLDVKATRVQVNPVSSVSLRTTRAGGIPDIDTATADTFTYTWQILDESNTDVTATAAISPVSGTVADTAVNNWTVTGLSTPGTYRFVATVRDRGGMQTTAAASVLLVEPLGLDVQANTFVVAPGGSVNLTFDRTGGRANFSYAFSNPAFPAGGVAGAFNLASPQSAADDLSTVTWTAPAAGANVEGTYRIDVVVTDDLTHTVTDSISILVQEDAPLTLDVRASTYVVAPGGVVNLTFDRTGGTPNFSYAFSNPAFPAGGAAGAFNLASPQTGADDLATVTWTAPAAAANVEGTYRIDVVATDGLAKTASDSISILVREDEPLTLDVRANTYVVAPGGVVSLTFDRTGGTPNFSYAYTNPAFPAGGAAGGFNLATPQTGADDLATVTWTAPAAAANVEGTYRIDVVVTDDLTNTASDSISILVQEDEPLTLDVRANTYVVAPGGVVSLTFDRTGGTPNFSYAYTNPAFPAGGAAGGFNLATPQTGADDLSTVTWTAPAAAANVEGTYRIDVVVTDDLTNTAADSIAIVVQEAESLALDVQADLTLLAQGVPVNIRSGATGGSGGGTDYQYLYEARDELNALVGTFNGGGSGTGTITVANQGLAHTITYAPPATGAGSSGTIRLDCTVTDVLNNSATDTVHLVITPDKTVVSADTFFDPITEEAMAGGSGSIEPGEEIGGTTSPYTFIPNNAPAHARNLKVRLNDPDTSATVTDVTIYGTNGRGDAISESTGALASQTTMTLNRPFASISRVVVTHTAVGANNDFIEIGVGRQFGLSAIFGVATTFELFATATDLDSSDRSTATFVDPATGLSTINTGNPQYVEFATAPDGTQDYIVQYSVAAQPLSLDVRSDLATVDVSNGDLANLTFDVSGGVGNYSYTYEAVGPSLTNFGQFTDPAGNQNAQTQTQAGVAGDTTAVWDAAFDITPAASGELWVILVTVTDSIGSSFTDLVLIEVVQ